MGRGVACSKCGATTPLPDDLRTPTFSCAYCGDSLATAAYAGRSAVSADEMRGYLLEVVTHGRAPLPGEAPRKRPPSRRGRQGVWSRSQRALTTFVSPHTTSFASLLRSRAPHIPFVTPHTLSASPHTTFVSAHTTFVSADMSCTSAHTSFASTSTTCTSTNTTCASSNTTFVARLTTWNSTLRDDFRGRSEDRERDTTDREPHIEDRKPQTSCRQKQSEGLARQTTFRARQTSCLPSEAS
jgi:hypothetical protein